MSEIPCRLYLSAPDGHPCDVLTTMLSDALANNDVAAVLYTPDNNENDICASDLMRCALDHGAAFIVAEKVSLAGKIGADGVHLQGDPELYKKARSELGKDRIIGLTTALNRHDSMCVGETGSNYIFFDPDIPNSHPVEEQQSLENLIGWWSDMFEVPCVAPAYADVEQNRGLINAGADFLCLGKSLWETKEDALKTLKSINQLIAECGRGP